MKFKKTILISIVLIFILTLSAVSAMDNSSDTNSGLLKEDTNDIVDSAYTGNSEDDVNQNHKLKFSHESDDELKKLDNNENQIKSISSDSLNVGVPKKVEIWSYSDVIYMNFSLPKNTKGKISIYKDDNHIKTFNLNEEELKKSNFFDNCTIYKEDNNKKDLYQVRYRLTNTDIGIKTFTFKYENGLDFIEKSGTVNITYILKPSTNKIYYNEKVLLIIAPPDLKGTVSVEIDGRKYKTYSKTYKRRYYINYKANCISNKCIMPYNNIKNQYVKLSPKLSIGKHKIKITYSGDGIYPSRSVEYTITVRAKIEAESFYLGDSRKISLELPKNAKGKLVLKFYDSKHKLVKTFTQKLKNGKAKIVIPKKFYGRFSKVVAKYNGKDYKVKSEVMKGVTINPPINIPKTMLEGEKKFISINLPHKKGVLKLYIYKYKKNGDFKLKEYSRKLFKGKAKISLSRFNDETEMSHVEFVETLKSGKKVTYSDYSICMIYKPLSISYLNLHYGKAQITIQAYKKGGKILKNKYITIKINDKFVKKVKTNKYGVANFKIPKKYKPKTYKLTAKYKKNSITEKIKIKKSQNKNQKKDNKIKILF